MHAYKQIPVRAGEQVFVFVFNHDYLHGVSQLFLDRVHCVECT